MKGTLSVLITHCTDNKPPLPFKRIERKLKKDQYLDRIDYGLVDYGAWTGRDCTALALTKTHKEQDKIFWRNRVNSSVFSIPLSQQRQKTSNFFTTFECDRLIRKLSQSALNASPIAHWIGSWHRTVRTSVPQFVPWKLLAFLTVGSN